MERPNAKLEKEMNSIGIFTEPAVPFAKVEGHVIAVEVEVGFPKGIELTVPDFDVAVENRRGVRTTFSDFKVVEQDDQTCIRFIAHQKLPEGVRLLDNVGRGATPFIDLCWYVGNEAIDPKMIPTVETVKRADYISCDLGWYLPSRFVDSLIDALGKLNETMLSGVMEDAILYGPIVKG